MNTGVTESDTRVVKVGCESVKSNKLTQWWTSVKTITNHLPFPYKVGSFLTIRVTVDLSVKTVCDGGFTLLNCN